jgi:ribosome recycling factor
MNYNFANFKKETKKIEDWLSREYMQIHTGRASPSFLDSVSVESYGQRLPVKNIASISIEDPKTLRVAPWDKGQIKEIEKAIQSANLGLSVATDAEGLRVIFPQLTAENRSSLIKVLKQKLEDARVSLRVEREKVWNDAQKLEREGKMTEDEKFRAKDELQKIIDEQNKSLEAIFAKKEKEVSA